MEPAGRFIPLPENRAALQAIQDLATGACPPLLFLHGPPGSGKSHLSNLLVEQFTHANPRSTSQNHSASEFGRELMSLPLERLPLLKEARSCDLLILEDLQFLPAGAADELAGILDRRQARNRPTLITASSGPAEVAASARLRSRLTGGLVVTLPAPGLTSRRLLARTWCRTKKLKVADDVIDWLARDPDGPRPMIGRLALLDVLAPQFPPPLRLEQVLSALPEEAPNQPEDRLDRLIQQVCRHYRVSEKALRGPSRTRVLVWPRQVAMFLAQRGGFTLARIGQRLGGRDHTTVLHACKVVEQARTNDPALARLLDELLAAASLDTILS